MDYTARKRRHAGVAGPVPGPFPWARVIESVDALKSEIGSAREMAAQFLGYRPGVPGLYLKTEREIERTVQENMSKVIAFYSVGERSITLNLGAVTESGLPEAVKLSLVPGQREGEGAHALYTFSSRPWPYEGDIAHEYFHHLQNVHSGAEPSAGDFTRYGTMKMMLRKRLEPAQGHSLWAIDRSARAREAFCMWALEGGADLFSTMYRTRGEGDQEKRLRIMISDTFMEYRVGELALIKKVAGIFKGGNADKIGALYSATGLSQRELADSMVPYVVGGFMALAMVLHDRMDFGVAIRDMLDVDKVRDMMESDSKSLAMAADMVLRHLGIAAKRR